jgi:hypothetical protein
MPNGDAIRKILVRQGLRDDNPGPLCQRSCVADEMAMAGGHGGSRVGGREAATANLTHANREGLVWLARLLLALAQERSLDGVLRKAIDAAAAGRLSRNRSGIMLGASPPLAPEPPP